MRPYVYTLIAFCWSLCPFSQSAHAAPSAANAGPSDAFVSVYLHDIQSFLREIDSLRAQLRFFGLGDEGFAALAALSQKELGINLLDADALTKAGLDLQRGAALFVSANPEPAPVFVFGVREERAVVAFVGRMLQDMGPGFKRVDGGKAKGAAARWAFTGNPAAELEISLIVQNGLGFLGPTNSLGYVAAGSPAQSMAIYPEPGAHTELGMWFDVEAAARLSGDRDLLEFANVITQGRFRVWSDAEGFHLDGDMGAGEAIRGLLPKFLPVYSDKAKQTAVFREFSRPPGLLTRIWIPLRGIIDWAQENQLLRPDHAQEFKKDTGLDLQTDIVDVFLGDATFVMPTGLADAHFQFSVRDAERARKTMLALWGGSKQRGGSSDSNAELTFKTSDHGKDAYVTEVHIREVSDWFIPRLFWTVRDGRLRIGINAASVEPIGSQTTSTWASHNPWVKPQLDTPSLVFSYSSAFDVYAAFQDLISTIRGMLGEKAAPFTDILDVPMLAAAAGLVSMASLDLDDRGLRLTSHGSLLSLAPNAAAGTPAGDFAAALKLLYAGKVETSHRAMGQLAQRFPDSPEGQRADRYVYAQNSGALLHAIMLSTGMSAAFLIPMRGGFDDAPAASAWEEPPAEPWTPPPPPDPCVMWAEMACAYKGDDSADCKKARKYLARKTAKFNDKERKQCALDLYELRGY